MAITSRETSDVSPYAVGNKVYGGGRPMPNIGPVDRMGYAERDAKASARRDAIERRMKANAKGDFASSDSIKVV
jgi:hypothetical protein